jgi:hypothetical protein
MNERQAYRSFISYIDRSREYYAAQGYTQPYTWARYSEVTFARLSKPLGDCRVGLVTTAGRKDTVTQDGVLPRELYAQEADPPPARMFTNHLFWDKKATHTDDIDSFLPLNRLAEFAREGRIGSVSPRFYGVPTDYSQNRTIKQDAPQILKWCREDGVEAVVLTAL